VAIGKDKPRPNSETQCGLVCQTYIKTAKLTNDTDMVFGSYIEEWGSF